MKVKITLKNKKSQKKNTKASNQKEIIHQLYIKFNCLIPKYELKEGLKEFHLL